MSNSGGLTCRSEAGQAVRVKFAAARERRMHGLRRRGGGCGGGGWNEETFVWKEQFWKVLLGSPPRP